jgi:hypothetical protein
MPSRSCYRTQAELFLRMALACSDPERAAQLQAQARLFLNLAGHAQDGGADPNALLEAFNPASGRTPPSRHRSASARCQPLLAPSDAAPHGKKLPTDGTSGPTHRCWLASL